MEPDNVGNDFSAILLLKTARGRFGKFCENPVIVLLLMYGDNHQSAKRLVGQDPGEQLKRYAGQRIIKIKSGDLMKRYLFISLVSPDFPDFSKI